MPRTVTKADELESLKRLVRKYLRETRYVPFRAADCNQTTVEDLMARLRKASRPTRHRRMHNTDRNAAGISLDARAADRKMGGHER